jgi:hypothetical protein
MQCCSVQSIAESVRRGHIIIIIIIITTIIMDEVD